MIYLLPGMGATSAMYQPPWDELPNATAVDWPSHKGETTIADLADRLIGHFSIQSSDLIVGSSLGGIVALEVHRKLKLRRIFLVGSAVTREEINGILMALAPMARLTPIRLIQHLAGKVNSLVSRMFQETDADFIQAMCIAVYLWKGYSGDLEAVTRIHGERDSIIPYPEDAHIIPGGGHLIAMTHPDECVRFIRKQLK
jgi:pimeloyl-ACP methyl ester carboxylesterase